MGGVCGGGRDGGGGMVGVVGWWRGGVETLTHRRWHELVAVRVHHDRLDHHLRRRGRRRRRRRRRWRWRWRWW